jgi:hypothetical protein
MITFHHTTANPYVKKHEKKGKYEKIDITPFVKNSRETLHAFEMANKILTNKKIIKIGWLCPALF